MSGLWRKVGAAIACGVMMLQAICSGPVYAADEFAITVSPMKEAIVLVPGDVYSSSFRVSNPGGSIGDLRYEIKAVPYYVDENYGAVFESEGDRNQILDWISFSTPMTGILKPNEVTTISYDIKVPLDAPAGGQYACINVYSNPEKGTTEGLGITERFSMGHLILAEIAGTTIYDGGVVGLNVPGFLFGGKIVAGASIQNNGNVHAVAKYGVQITPLFSDVPIYDDTVSPEERTVLPDRTLYNEIIWNETPQIGAFRVKYVVEFEGITTEVEKVVFVCPVWLLFGTLFLVMAIVIRVVALSKVRRTRKVQRRATVRGKVENVRRGARRAAHTRNGVNVDVRRDAEVERGRKKLSRKRTKKAKTAQKQDTPVIVIDGDGRDEKKAERKNEQGGERKNVRWSAQVIDIVKPVPGNKTRKKMVDSKVGKEGETMVAKADEIVKNVGGADETKKEEKTDEKKGTAEEVTEAKEKVAENEIAKENEKVEENKGADGAEKAEPAEVKEDEKENERISS